MNLKTGKRFAFFLISAVLLATVVSYLPARAAQPAPDFTLKSTDAKSFTLSQYKGQKPVLIYFFATWCHFCQAMGPKVAALKQNPKYSDLAILAVDVGSGDSFEKAKLYAKDKPYTVLYDEGTKVTRTYGVEGIPNIVLVDKKGEIKYQGSELPEDLKRAS